MEVGSRPLLPPIAGHHYARHEQHPEIPLQSQPSHQLKVNARSLPSPLSMDSSSRLPPLQSIPQKASGSSSLPQSPAMKSLVDPHYARRESPGETPNHPVSGAQQVPQVVPSLHSSPVLPSINGHHYPRSPREVGLDAIERLQTQVSLNRGALAAHTRDIRRGEEVFQHLEDSLRREFQGQIVQQASELHRVNEAVARLQLEMQNVHQALEGVTRELHASRSAGLPTGQSISVQDSALELMAQQVAVISHKANEVDTLKITIEIMKNKIQRLEDIAGPEPSQAASQHRTLSTTMPQAVQHNHPVNTHHASPVTAPFATPSQPANIQTFHSYETPSSTVTPDATQRRDSVPAQGRGWATVNAGVKRTHPNGVESPREATIHNPGSPKRQRLAAGGPSATFTTPQSYGAPLPSLNSNSEPRGASQTQHPTYIPHSAQDGPSENNWQSETQHVIEHRPRGRGRGGGSGSRGGRARKSTPMQPLATGTTEWEQDQWRGPLEAQGSPEEYYNHATRSVRGVARRGSSGSTRGGYTPSDRALSLGVQGTGVTMSMGSPVDPYAHTKRTRTKPIRNAEGVLIRKDGRPDMRSQSSAANLRKVHARKEDDATASPPVLTPTQTQFTTPASAPDTPSSDDQPTDQNVTPSVHKKHNAIMDKMFPGGVDASRKEHDYAHQVFEDGQDHTVHSRTRKNSVNNRPVSQSRHQKVQRDGHSPSQSTQNSGADVAHPTDGQAQAQSNQEALDMMPISDGAVKKRDTTMTDTNAA